MLVKQERGERERTDLAQTRVLGRTESIPVLVLASAHEPGEEFGLFFVGPVLCTLASGVEVVGVSVVEVAAVALDDMLDIRVDMLALDGGRGGRGDTGEGEG